jgi:hypothetical protein
MGSVTGKVTMPEEKAPEQKSTPALDWERITSLPDDIHDRRILRRSIEEDLNSQFRCWLQKESQTAKAGEKLLDDFILYKAKDSGVRILLSDAVLLRVMQCVFGGENEVGVRGPTKDGIHYLERFVEALVKNAKQRIGNERAEVDSKRAKDFKSAVKKELNSLQKQLTKNTRKQCKDEWLEIETIISTNPITYPRLHQNLTGLKAFCAEDLNRCKRFAGGKFTAADFCNEWGGWSTNLDPETFRQKVANRK